MKDNRVPSVKKAWCRKKSGSPIKIVTPGGCYGKEATEVVAVKIQHRRERPPMAKGEEIPKTDLAEIEAVIERLKQSNIDRRDVELIERRQSWPSCSSLTFWISLMANCSRFIFALSSCDAC